MMSYSEVIGIKTNYVFGGDTIQPMAPITILFSSIFFNTEEALLKVKRSQSNT